MKMITKFCGLLCLLIAGCAGYPSALLVDGVISNPAVGWSGYSVRIPEGVQHIAPSVDENVPDREMEIRKWYEEANARFVFDYDLVFYEQFLFENPGRTFFLSFLTDTFDFTRCRTSAAATGHRPSIPSVPSSWMQMTSVEKEYTINRLISRKKVVINDTGAHAEQVKMHGQRGWYISGTARPYFKRNPKLLAYEGVFLIGNLKEVFWIEAFGGENDRAEMKKLVFEMAGSLQVNKP